MTKNILLLLLAVVLSLGCIGCEPKDGTERLEDPPQTVVFYKFNNKSYWEPANGREIEITGDQSEFDLKFRSIGLLEGAVSIISTNDKCSATLIDELDLENPNEVIVIGNGSTNYYHQRVHVDMDVEKSIILSFIHDPRGFYTPCEVTITRK